MGVAVTVAVLVGVRVGVTVVSSPELSSSLASLAGRIEVPFFPAGQTHPAPKTKTPVSTIAKQPMSQSVFGCLRMIFSLYFKCALLIVILA
jgi:hypothetical protein